jgi:glycosyltransferase involved in cell wall biosynthesis
MTSPLISIIMSVYNENPSWIESAINSVINQSYSNIEFIIVMDNPSNTKILELLYAYQEQEESISVFVNDKNEGLVYSLNLALDKCHGEYVARMDADDICHLDRLEKQLHFLVCNNLDLVGANVNLFNDSGVFYTTNKLLTHKYLKKMLSNGTIGIVHPTFFAKLAVYRALDGYKHSLHTEDKEFLARVFCHDFKVGNTKDVLLDCRYNNNSVTKVNAIYVNKVGIYVTEVFNNYLMTGCYEFDEKYHESLNISEEEIVSYNKKQILMGRLRGDLYSKNYVAAFIKIIKATYYSRSIFLTIKINFKLKLFKFLERLECHR